MRFLDVPSTVCADFAAAFDALLVDAATAPWDFWFGLLEKYFAEHGTARVPPLSIDGGYGIGGGVAK